MITGATAQSDDPHKLYENRCGGCHAPHAGEFVNDHLVLRSGKMFGRKSGREIGTFLQNGHGGLKPVEIPTLMMHITDIRKSGGLYRKKCIICHDRAVVFARNRLVIQDGGLVGRYSKRKIDQFLAGHGRLSGSEVPGMVGVLKRQLTTAEPAID